MIRKILTTICLLVTPWLSAQTIAAAEEMPAEYVARAARFLSPPKVDGQLDEPLWRQATVLRRFTQMEPKPGNPGTDSTEVLIGYDEKMLYVGVRFGYEDVSLVTANFMNRDPVLANDDSIQFVIDTFSDGMTAFLFGVNSIGAQVDALVRSNGDEVNYGWDSVWYSKTAPTADGWSAEIAIPFRALRFPSEPVQSWGFNVMRSRMMPQREIVIWRPNDLGKGPNALFKVSQAGRLDALQDIRQGRKYEIKPYVLVAAERNDITGDDEEFEVGVDYKQNIASNLTLDLTYNLDFSEVEIDNQQVNLTRFKLFFPEKRDFFLEGSSLFYFGDRADDFRTPERIFFFSRRIGLTEDGRRTVPVLGGVKLSGKVGRTNLGVLNLTTDKLDSRFDPDAPPEVYQTNFSVVRVKQDVFKRSSVGLMWLNKDVRDGRDNSGTGFDWDFGISKHLRTGGFLARTKTPGLTGDDWAGMADVVWDSNSLFAKASYAEVREDFNPEMGFFQRVGVRESRGNVIWIPRPDFWNLREVWVVADYLRVTDLAGNLESENSRLETDWAWPNIVVVSPKLFYDTEVVKTPFEIQPGVFIRPGQYRHPSFFFGFQTIPAKPVFFFARLQVGDLYGGTFETRVAGFRLRPMKGLFSRIFYENTLVRNAHVDPQRSTCATAEPVCNFTLELFSLNVTYSVSPRLSSRALIEWQNDDNLSANISLKWIYKPGAAFYVVYNEFRDLNPARDELKDQSLIVKTTFYF